MPAGTRPSTPPTASRSRRWGSGSTGYEEQLAIITGLWGTPVGGDLRLRRASTTGCPDSPALPKPVAGRRHPGHRRRQGQAAHAAAGRPVRRRSSTSRSRPLEDNGRLVRPACARRARRPGATRRPWSELGAGRSASAGTTPRWPAGPTRSAGTSTSCGENGVAGTPAEAVDDTRPVRRGRCAAGVPAGARPRRPRPPGPGRERGGAPAASRPGQRLTPRRGTSGTVRRPASRGTRRPAWAGRSHSPARRRSRAAAQHGGGGRVLDALGDQADAEVVGQGDGVLDDRGRPADPCRRRG